MRIQNLTDKIPSHYINIIACRMEENFDLIVPYRKVICLSRSGSYEDFFVSSPVINTDIEWMENVSMYSILILYS